MSILTWSWLCTVQTYIFNRYRDSAHITKSDNLLTIGSDRRQMTTAFLLDCYRSRLIVLHIEVNLIFFALECIDLSQRICAERCVKFFLVYWAIVLTETTEYKMNFRLFYYLKQKLLCVFIFCIVVLSAVYFYTTRVQVAYTTEHWSGGRCFSELTSLKYQLNGKKL